MVYRMVAASAPVLLLLLLSLSVASTGSEPSPSSADREERKSSDIHSISQDLEVLRKALLENDPSLLYGKKETDTEAETGKKCSASSHPARPRAAMMTARQEGISAATELLQKECHLSAEEAEMVKRDIDEGVHALHFFASSDSDKKAFAHERGTADPNAPPVFGFGRIAFRLLYQGLRAYFFIN